MIGACATSQPNATAGTAASTKNARARSTRTSSGAQTRHREVHGDEERHVGLSSSGWAGGGLRGEGMTLSEAANAVVDSWTVGPARPLPDSGSAGTSR